MNLLSEGNNSRLSLRESCGKPSECGTLLSRSERRLSKIHSLSAKVAENPANAERYFRGAKGDYDCDCLINSQPSSEFVRQGVIWVGQDSDSFEVDCDSHFAIGAGEMLTVADGIRVEAQGVV